jgi:predicted cupin superfamily sugar epimerase
MSRPLYNPRPVSDAPDHPDGLCGELIERLGLAPHPEGGWFRETHRSSVLLEKTALPAGYGGDRAASTSILFLLRAGERSLAHRVRGEEIWLHQGGDPLRLRYWSDADPDADTTVTLGPATTHAPQAVVPPGWWQEAATIDDAYGWSLVGCVVAPGFDFDDFQMQDTARS